MASILPRPGIVLALQFPRHFCPQSLPHRPLRARQKSSASSPRWTSTTAAELDSLFERVSLEPTSATDGYHIIHSTGRNPYANLAVEHRLFQRAHPASRLLMLYRNAPCVVIGRNQNPWTEVNLGHLKKLSKNAQLVRRRSGGGAVYHDAGNANWSVHVPTAVFDRDQHALMVARALQRLGVASARVNERHDIVVAGMQGMAGAQQQEFKVSGSAYKLTKRRAMHHGTCLLGADLAAVSGLLRAPPAAPYLKARGVASVRSPVQNVTLPAQAETQADRDAFGDAVAAEFQGLYGVTAHSTVVNVDALAAEADAFAFDPALAQGYAELRTPDWLYGQTPQFTFSTQPTEEDPRERPERPAGVPASFDMRFTVRHGHLHDIVITGLAKDDDVSVDNSIAVALDGQVLYTIKDWRAVLADASPVPVDETHAAATGAWLNELFGVECFSV